MFTKTIYNPVNKINIKYKVPTYIKCCRRRINIEVNDQITSLHMKMIKR